MLLIALPVPGVNADSHEHVRTHVRSCNHFGASDDSVPDSIKASLQETQQKLPISELKLDRTLEGRGKREHLSRPQKKRESPGPRIFTQI